MRRTVLVLFVITAIASVVHAQQDNKGLHRGEPIHGGFLKAGQYLEIDESFQRFYAMGLLDGMYMSPAFGAPASNKVLVKVETCVEGMKAAQVAAIIAKYVKDHPEEWDWDLHLVGYNAMLEGCQNR